MDCCEWNVPSLPVNPWTISFVFLSTSTLIISSGDDSRSEFDYFLSRVPHVRAYRKVESGVEQNLPPRLDVRAFHADHDRHLDIQIARRRYDAGSQRVATQNAAENVDQHRFDALIGKQNLERIRYLLRARTAAHIEEV